MQFRFLLNIESLLEKLKERDIPLCRPEISNEREITINGGHDPALILKRDIVIVPNDVRMGKNGKFIFLLGANGEEKQHIYACSGQRWYFL
jgi:DNA mismatch repair ATPase MutS